MSKVILTITLDTATGDVGVTGPIHDRVLCYGLMGIARDVIDRNARAKANGANAIVVPQPIVPDDLVRGDRS